MTDRPDTPTDDQQADSCLPEPDCILEEYDLGEHEVLRGVLHDLKWDQSDQSVGEEAVRAYLSEQSENESTEPILQKIRSSEAAELADSLVRREMRVTAARLQLQKARDAFDRAHREKEAASEHLLKVLRRTADLPSDTNWRVNATRGTVHELGFPTGEHCLELALSLFKRPEPELAVIAEDGILPDPMEEKVEKVEEELPGSEARKFLVDLAGQLRQFGKKGREFVLSMLSAPDSARAIARDQNRSDPIRFIAQLRLDIQG